MRLSTVILVVLGLTACAAQHLPDPDRISLNTQRLKVYFRDGTTCAADLTVAKAGRLPDCAQAVDYIVDIRHPPIVAGTALEPMFQPYATVTLTRPQDGRDWVWTTPRDER
ncbi:MAG TPA: hypothetical protein VGC40_12500 [Paenirhodobacter sp.]